MRCSLPKLLRCGCSVRCSVMLAARSITHLVMRHGQRQPRASMGGPIEACNILHSPAWLLPVVPTAPSGPSQSERSELQASRSGSSPQADSSDASETEVPAHHTASGLCHLKATMLGCLSGVRAPGCCHAAGSIWRTFSSFYMPPVEAIRAVLVCQQLLTVIALAG